MQLLCRSLAVLFIFTLPHQLLAGAGETLLQEGAAATSPADGTLEFRTIGNRYGNRFTWTVTPDGSGMINIPFHLGHRVSGKGLDVLFPEGEHKINIGSDGYAELRKLFAGIIAKGSQSTLFCRRAADDLGIFGRMGSAELVWHAGEKGGMAGAEIGCKKGQDSGRLLHRKFDSAWHVLGRRLSVQNSTAAIAIPIGSDPHRWDETLRYSDFNGRSNRMFEIAPDGTGKIFTKFGWNHGGYSDPDYYSIPDGENRFDMGKAGYLKVRASLNDIVAGKVPPMVSPANCKTPFHTSARVGRLKWEIRADHSGYFFDSSCNSAKNARAWGMLETAFFHIGRNLTKPD